MLFKVTDEEGQSAHGVDVAHAEYLPAGNDPAPWMPPIEGELVYQQHGYHCGDESQILEWLGPVIYAVEHEGEMLEVPRAKVARRIRLTRKCTSWTEKAARQFAVECAQRVLPVFEEVSDKTAPRDAITKAAGAPANFPAPAAAQYADEMDELKTAAEAVAEEVKGELPLAAHAANAAASAASGYDPGAVAAKYAAQFARLARGDAAEEERAWQANRLLEILNG
jgi:hypothetical protein